MSSIASLRRMRHESPSSRSLYITPRIFHADEETLRERASQLAAEKTTLYEELRVLQEEVKEKEDVSGRLKAQIAETKKQTIHGSAAFQQIKHMPHRRSKLKPSLQSKEPRIEDDAIDEITRLTNEKGKILAKLRAIPRRDLLSLPEMRVETEKLVQEKVELEKSISAFESGDLTSEETELAVRSLKQQVKSTATKVKKYKLNARNQRAKIQMLTRSIQKLEEELESYAKSNVLLKSVFKSLPRSSLDQSKVGIDVAVRALISLSSSQNGYGDLHQIRSQLVENGVLKKQQESINMQEFIYIFKALFDAPNKQVRSS